jgi:hypothetical protein
MSLDPTILSRGPATVPVSIVRQPMHRATAQSILAGAVPPVTGATRRRRHAARRPLGRGIVIAIGGSVLAVLAVIGMALAVIL